MPGGRSMMKARNLGKFLVRSLQTEWYSLLNALPMIHAKKLVVHYPYQVKIELTIVSNIYNT